MSDRLFQHSLHAIMQDQIRRAAEAIGRLDRSVFADPQLNGKLREIEQSLSLDVATIDDNGITAKAREEHYEASEYGRVYRGTRKLLDVSIPFTGDEDSFQLSPSRSAVIMHRVTIGRGSLTLTIPDDQNAQREVDTVVGQLKQNLDTIRKEYEAFKPEIQQAINAAAILRKDEIAADGERDKGRRFKVER